MEIFDVAWPTDHIASGALVKDAYAKILEAGLVLDEYITCQNHEEERMLTLVKDVNMMVLMHMEFEIEMLKMADIEGWRRHRLEHMTYKQKYDMCFKCEISDEMRIVMTAKMLKEFTNKHVYEYDVPDVEKLNAALEDEDEEMAS